MDEDFPGTIGFSDNEIMAMKNQDKVDVIIKRVEGTDGRISCMIRTEPLFTDPSLAAASGSMAMEFEDYLPKHEKIEFLNGESEKLIQIYLVNEKVPQIEGKNLVDANDEDDDAAPKKLEDEDDEAQELMFKIKIEKAEPESVKISKKNVCFVKIAPATQMNNDMEEHTKLMQYFVE